MLDEQQTKHPLSLKSIQQILDEKYAFYVPAYQRGYRWTAHDVELLIQDLIHFKKEEDVKDPSIRCPFYSLQVGVLKNGEKNLLDVIDGQQRLTTVLILLQALHTIQLGDIITFAIQSENTDILIKKGLYSIKYETREKSDTWLREITKAYCIDKQDGTTCQLERLKERNSDYYHFVEAFSTAMIVLGKMNEDDRNDFQKTLNQQTKFIWYNTSLNEVAELDVDIFNRLNATKISLNNAELIKALLLQEGNFKDVPIDFTLRLEDDAAINEGSRMDILYERDQIAIDWDNLEKQLQEPTFWGFSFPSRHPFSYETRIEYLFDLIQNKTESDRDDYYYTFNKYYKTFLTEPNKLKFVRDSWAQIQEMFLLLQEWYNDKVCYHYIGYLLEYGINEFGNPISVLDLKDKLSGLKKDERERTLIELVKYSLQDIKGNQLVYGNPSLTQVLFLFNIELELRRKNAMSKFSFADFKDIHSSIGWNQEHIASHVDYEPRYEKRIEIARDLLEYFTGIRYSVEDANLDIIENAIPTEKKANELCGQLLQFFNQEISDEIMRSVYDSILSYFDADDRFIESIPHGRKTLSEKDFIWNFVLLNSHTNKSYGNHIYPVKRQRIQRDENDVYTPIGTRFVFEKAFSTKLTNLMAWGRNDAISYWNAIQNTIGYLFPNMLTLPDYISIDK